ncbi:MAG: hypothetical protein WAM91_14855 [Candidatus Acidiferrales bacterium]
MSETNPSAPVTAGPPAATPGASPAVGATPPQPKIKVRKPRQRACDEKDDKGKFCFGHLKRWYDYPKEIEALVGHNAEIYRCEFCKTIYKPNLAEMPHSYTLRT